MKVLITDANFRNSIALARHLRLFDHRIILIGYFEKKLRFSTPYQRFFSKLAFGDLERCIRQENPDLVIPVGYTSVENVSAIDSAPSVLPLKGAINTALNKRETLCLAESLGIPIPRTYYDLKSDDLPPKNLTFPCVVKGTWEAGENAVAYVSNVFELKRAFDFFQKNASQRDTPPLVQELVHGQGLGFFAFYQAGKLKRFYMHKRLREFPITGGSSTAAKTTFHPQAFDYGKRLLDSLQWNGVAMVEFKWDATNDRLYLMEINPKFWGSVELGLTAGINFGELLVRSIRGETVKENHSPTSYRDTQFFWPFEGDLLGLVQTRNWSAFRSYFNRSSKSNFRSNGLLLNGMRIMQYLHRIHQLKKRKSQWLLNRPSH